MRTGKDRVQVDAIGEPVTLGGVRVCAGDFIVADEDGVVVIPAARAEEVLKRALEMHEVEQRIVAAGLAGMKLSTARKQFGYHALQRNFTAETETRELLIFASEDDAIRYCEGLDVEAGIWLFWDAVGNPLEPEFFIPNKRGWISVANGVYDLISSKENHHAPLHEALEHIKCVDKNKFFETIDDIREYLSRHSKSSSIGDG